MNKQNQAQSQQQAEKPQAITAKQEIQGLETAVVNPMQNLQRSYTNPNNLTAADAQTLQRIIGNQALRRLSIQRKMTLGSVGDKYEQEADAVAKQVVNNLQSPQVGSPTSITAQRQEEEMQMKPLVQRQEGEEDVQMKPFQPVLPHLPFLQRQDENEEEEVQAKRDPMLDGGELSQDVESSVQSAKFGGVPLSDNVRQPMESAFNADFSSVKVHTDNQSDHLNRSLSARAFTSGQDIFFRSGEYNPSSSSGKELLAHELTHTVQQGGNLRRQTIQRAVGFEFEDPLWTIAQVQSGRSFRKPTGFGSAFSSGHIAEPGSEKSDEELAVEKYTGINAWQESDSGTHINSKFGKFNLQTGPKKGTLHQGKDYVIEPDGPYDTDGLTNRMDLEIVTEPFPETEAGQERLIAALDDMESVMNPLFAQASGAYTGGEFSYDRFIKPDQTQFSNSSIYVYGGQAGGAFKPQVTSGFELADMPEVMQTVGKVRGESEVDSERRAPVRTAMFGERGATDTIVGVSPQLADTAIAKLKLDGILDQEDTSALKGFLSIAFMYLQKLASVGPSGVKIAIPLLSRFSLNTLYEQVPEDVREAIGTRAGRTSFVAGVSDALIGEIGARRGNIDGPMIGIKTGIALHDQHPEFVEALRSFTRKDWLLNILDGNDLLKPDDLITHLRKSKDTADTATKYDKSFGIYSRGHGNTQNVKDVAGQNTGGLALVENRAIAPKGADSGITLKEARAFALSYFSWARSIKEARDRINTPPVVPMRRRGMAFSEKPQMPQVEEDNFDDIPVGSPQQDPSPLALAMQQDETNFDL